VSVVTLKPGFVDTPMTSGVKKNPLFSSAERAGRDVHRAIQRPRDVVYIPWFWGPIMALVRLLPESIFKRLHL
jgi:short-subunit dehydrogenase